MAMSSSAIDAIWHRPYPNHHEATNALFRLNETAAMSSASEGLPPWAVPRPEGFSMDERVGKQYYFFQPGKFLSSYFILSTTSIPTVPYPRLASDTIPSHLCGHVLHLEANYEVSHISNMILRYKQRISINTIGCHRVHPCSSLSCPRHRPQPAVASKVLDQGDS